MNAPVCQLPVQLLWGHRPSALHPSQRSWIHRVPGVPVCVFDPAAIRSGVSAARRAIAQVRDAGRSVCWLGHPRSGDAARTAASFRNEAYLERAWPPGWLTNRTELTRTVHRLAGSLDPRDAVNRARWDRRYPGARSATGPIDLLVVLGAAHHPIAVAEARACGVPVVALVDSNASAEGLLVAVPGNDDSRIGLEWLAVALGDPTRG